MRWIAASIVFWSVGALAQQKPVESRGGVTFSLDRSRNAAADAARAKAVAGDCKGALDLFDEALRHSIDPTLFRDRGSCHEKLGNVYPAIDDYRSYVSQNPDAPDADRYRKRVEELIGTASQDIAPATGRGGTFDSEMRGGMTDGSTPVTTVTPKKEKDDGTSKTKEDPNKTLTQLEVDETRDRESQTSPLRTGKGFVLGVYLYPRYVFNAFAFQFGQGYGVRLGYSFAGASTLFLELGGMSQLSTGTDASKNGFTAIFGYEARIPFDQYASNQLVLGAAGGYENLNDNTLGLVYSSFVARGRAGWRHVFGPAFSLDLLADGGLMGTFILSAPSGTKDFDVGAFIGLDVAVNVGF